MEELLKNILYQLRTNPDDLGPEFLEKTIRAANKGNTDVSTHIGKRALWPFLLYERDRNTPFFQSLKLTTSEINRLESLLTTKPIRTASGVATVTVLTKPFPCSGECIFCPNDIRMPKSYMHSEPACQRAELLWFDPYLQVYKRLEVLREMGHDTGKVELIILGGTWTDYPGDYQRWFVARAFAALNDFGSEHNECSDIEMLYQRARTAHTPKECAAAVKETQEALDDHRITYNEAYKMQYESNEACPLADWAEVEAAHKANERAHARCVGLVMETRPDKIDETTLRALRRLGATKLQMGIQSTSDEILLANARHIDGNAIARAFALARLFGFKIHAHAMLNLLDATPQNDLLDYASLIENQKYKPDEIKLYPCALVSGTRLEELYKKGVWQPYTTEELVETLALDVLKTPPYTRITRMIRDIPSTDILVGNKKTNLRQMVEARAIELSSATDHPIQEIRMREIHHQTHRSYGMSTMRYETEVTEERFIQMTTPSNQIAGFCRLSLPKVSALQTYPGIPSSTGDAMIRELHVYGVSVGVGEHDANAQHQGMGTALLQEAEQEARDAGYTNLRVIASVGTRDYYRNRGFVDADLYLKKEL